MLRSRTANVLALAILFGLSAPATAQAPFTFKLQPGMKLRYVADHQTVVEVTQGKEKSATTSTVRQVKEWNVIDVDSFGEATVELTLRRLQFEQTEPGGQTLKFDSENQAQSHPDLVKQLGALVNKTVLQARMTKYGVLKSSKAFTDQGSIARELPFIVAVPDEFPKEGLAWQRESAVTLEAPLGHGQAFKVLQTCRIERLTDTAMVLAVESRVADEVNSTEERVSLAQFQPKGRVTLDRARGLLQEAALTTDEKVEGFAGKESLYHFKSTYNERLLDGNEQADRRR